MSDFNHKILFVSHYTSLYGANRSLLGLIDYISGKAQIHVLMPDKGPLLDEIKKRKIEYTICKFHPFMNAKSGKSKNTIFRTFINKIKDSLRRTNRRRINKSALHFLAKFFKGKNFSLVYSNSSVIDIGFHLASELKVPHIFHIREFATLDYELYPDGGNKYAQKILNKSSHLVFVSESLYQFHKKDLIDTSFSVIPNGVISQSEAHEIDVNIPKTDYITFCIIGLLHKNKGQLFALKSFRNFLNKGGNGRLLIVGGGDNNLLADFIKRHNLTQTVRLLGYQIDPFETIKKSNVLLMCSKYEAFGRVTAEAMIAGRPVIGINSNGTKEIIDHHVNGFLVPAEIDKFSNAMLYCYRNIDLLKELGMNARNKALKNYTNEKNGSEIRYIIENKLNAI